MSLKHFQAEIDGTQHDVTLKKITESRVQVVLDQKESELDIVKVGPQTYSVLQAGHSYLVQFSQKAGQWRAFVNGIETEFSFKDERQLRREKASSGGANAGGQIVCQMPGKIVDIKVKVGQKVKIGEGLIVVEAMKMQNEFKAAVEGVVSELSVKVGDSVEGGTVLIVISEA